MYYTGLDPFTKKPVYVAKQLSDRKMQRALLQFFKPENYFEVRRALERSGRTDLIGSGCDCLIPARAPSEAIEKRRNEARRTAVGDHYHAVPRPAKSNPGEGDSGSPKSSGYRPGRKSARRREDEKQPRRRGDDHQGRR
jgi:hypothetical protein